MFESLTKRNEQFAPIHTQYANLSNTTTTKTTTTITTTITNY